MKHVLTVLGSAAVLVACNAATSSVPIGSSGFQSVLAQPQVAAVRAQEFGGLALPNGNYLCVANGGKAMGLQISGQRYLVAMKYDQNVGFYDWQAGDYAFYPSSSVVNPNSNSRFTSGTVSWNNGPMTNWNQYNVGFFATSNIIVSTPTGGFRRSDFVGEITFRVWETDVSCSPANFQAFGGRW